MSCQIINNIRYGYNCYTDNLKLIFECSFEEIKILRNAFIPLTNNVGLYVICILYII